MNTATGYYGPVELDEKRQHELTAEARLRISKEQEIKDFAALLQRNNMPGGSTALKTMQERENLRRRKINIEFSPAEAAFLYSQIIIAAQEQENLNRRLKPHDTTVIPGVFN